VGALTLAILAQRISFRHGATHQGIAWVGRACALVSGFTSFVANAGGPPINAYTLR